MHPNNNTTTQYNWITDSEAFDHMNTSLDNLTKPRISMPNAHVNLLKGNIADISHVGSASLRSGMELKNVLKGPDLKAQYLVYTQVRPRTWVQGDFLQSNVCYTRVQNPEGQKKAR